MESEGQHKGTWTRREALIECVEPYQSRINAVLNLWLENYISAKEARKELLAQRHHVLVADDGLILTAKTTADVREKSKETASVLDALRIGFMAVAWGEAEEVTARSGRQAILRRAGDLVIGARSQSAPAGPQL